MKGLLDNYEFHTHFYGGKKDYKALFSLVEASLEKQRYDKSRVDVMSLGPKSLQGLVVIPSAPKEDAFSGSIA